MKIQGFKRIIAEDFDEKDRTLIQKLAYSINSLADDINRAFTNNISIDDNLNIVKKEVTLSIDSSGAITGGLAIKTGLAHTCEGITVIKVTNTTSPSTYPTGTPWVSFSENTSGLLTVNNITNLPAGNTYKIKMLLF